MSDLQSLEANILAEIAAADDEAALEAVRVSALGKKGTVSALLATLGKLTPEERKSQGPLLNGLKERVTAAIGARKDALKDAALNQRLNTETLDVTLPVRETPAEKLVDRVRGLDCVEQVDAALAILTDLTTPSGSTLPTLCFGWPPENFGYEDLKILSGRKLVAGDHHKAMLGK